MVSGDICSIQIITAGERSPYERFTLYIYKKNSPILFNLHPPAIQMTVCDDKGTHFHDVELSGSKYIRQACHKTSTKMAYSLMASYYNYLLLPW